MITNDIKNNKIVLGISGGVDSTTAALLLLEKGYDVYGMYFNIHESGAGERAAAETALKEAYAAYEKKYAKNDSVGSNADKEAVRYSDEKFIYIDASQEFKDIVISDFCHEYRLGHTPNPCVVCNPNIKFKLLCKTADKVGAYYIATGHYADIAFVPDRSGGTYYIKAADSKKDQSYMLYRLPQEVIRRLVLPLSEFAEKEETRNIARENNLSSAEKSDSQEICFIENNASHAEFIREFSNDKGENCKSNDGSVINTGTEEGDFVDNTGKVLGQHKGIVNYTIGQRKGLGIALGHPVFVTDIDCEKNTVTLGENEELFKSSVLIGDLFFTETGGAAVPSGIHKKNLTAKVRYAAPRAAVKIAAEDSRKCEKESTSCAADAAASCKNTSALSKCCCETLTLIFEKPQRAMTPGQSLVIYDGDLVIGGGRIIKAL